MKNNEQFISKSNRVNYCLLENFYHTQKLKKRAQKKSVKLENTVLVRKFDEKAHK